MCSYLHQRHGSPIYYFRRRVPDNLRPIIGKREWLISLGAKDRGEAKRLIPFHTIETEKLIAAARAKLAALAMPAPQPLPPLTPEQQARDVAQREHEQAQAAHEDELAAAEEAMDDRANKHDDAIDALLIADPTSLNSRDWAIRRRIHDAVSEREIARMQTMAAKYHAAKLERQVPDAGGQPSSMDGAPMVGEPVKLEALLDAYAAEHGSRAKRGFASSQTHIRSLREFLPALQPRHA
ncbi:hypothetical protein FJQ54_07225 [Sandaracinobacter neustonicus]|uniref:DUF6538 domain-containing protein n=1 Tax=Sandaracinobacter neustonicus TaxID=1715348 RepID=A0A501XNZ8_9SPHN|nr:DUF6538 domain-containing protein [Sandaracinobacter neustonicus]TPE62306.1 hypothetical protein FJQ54_07225 [Sandaracinobacter neustonicus]